MDYWGSVTGVAKGDVGSLDYSSYFGNTYFGPK